jgi:FtsP/CotA-like multicopper oxidase with cupredoxin domain
MKLLRNPQHRRRVGWVAAATLAAGALVSFGLPSSQAAGGTSEGVACDRNSDGGVYNLDARSGYATTPDGNSIYMWSYGDSTGAFQLPGPTLCVHSGDKVTVVLHNTLPEPTSIVFSGQTAITANGAVAQPQFTTPGDPSTPVTSLVQPAAPNGSMTYQFTAGRPGTYLYSSGTDVTKQRQMGLYGGLIVRPAGGSRDNYGNDLANSKFKADAEYLFLLSEVDPDLHLAVERHQPYDYKSSKARYFMINGRSMPDTLAPNYAAWLPSQPYGATVHVQPYDVNINPDAALIRYLNAGSEDYPFHPHGSSETVITRDGAPSVNAAGQDSTYDKYLIDVAPGQSVDAKMIWANEYDPQGKKVSQGGSCSDGTTADVGVCQALPSDIQLPQLQDQIVGPGTETWFSENPYLGAPGGIGPIPNGVVQNNECGEYYHIAHSHALYQATNYGASFGGMMTLFRIDPPAGCPVTP